MTNRVIKFRAWHKEQNRMYSAAEMGADQLTLMTDGRGFANISSSNPKLSQIDDGNKMIPMQFTGLLDKNGKEIYEGDVVQYGDTEYSRGEVEYVNSCFKVVGVNLEERMLDDYMVEIIGNIYDNPDLLK